MVNELMIFIIGMITFYFLCITAMIVCGALIFHIIVNNIVFPKQTREDLYYYLQNKEKIKKYIMELKK